MPWMRIDPASNSARYIVGRNPHYHLSRDKKGAVDEIPEGWEVIIKDGRLKLVRKI